MAVNSTFDGPDLSDGASSFAGSDLSDDFSVDDAVEELGDGVKGLQLSQLVGRGAFGAVYKVSWRGRPAALKVIDHEDQLDRFPPSPSTDSFGNSSAGGFSSMRSSQALLEAAVSSAIRHPCIVETYDYQLVAPGIGTSSDPLNILTGTMELRIVMEWCDAGSLVAALNDGRLQPVGIDGNAASFEAICITLLEVAMAMDHLHTMHIMHCDLKAKNVLLAASKADARGFSAKVSDFGLSKLIADPSVTSTSTASGEASGTVTHMAPETLAEGKASPAADVYAFGILMWEAYMGEAPYRELAKMQVMYGVVAEQLRPRFPPGAPEWYRRLAAMCWAQLPLDRPTFSEVVSQLRQKLWQVHNLHSRRHGGSNTSRRSTAYRALGAADRTAVRTAVLSPQQL